MDQIQLNIKVNGSVSEFQDQRIQAGLNWDIKKLKGVLREIYKSTDEQKLIYSGKLLQDTSVLKDVLRYDGQEAHTVHLVFTPKLNSSKKYYENQRPKSDSMNSEGLRHRSNAAVNQSQTSDQQTQQQSQPNLAGPSGVQQNTSTTTTATNNQNIPNNLFNFNNLYAPMNAGTSAGTPQDYLLAQQFAMQTWMQQAYTQYLNQYMNVLSMGAQPDFFSAQYQQQQQASQQLPNFPSIGQPTIPLIPFAMPTLQSQATPAPTTPSVPSTTDTPTESVPSTTAAQEQSPSPQENVAAPAAAPQQPEAVQPRFPNIIQDEQETRDWLDILYSLSRLMILLCLVYFYSSPFRCLIVVIIGIAIYSYHIYKQNINRLNNNSPRVNNNNLRPPPAPAAENNENVARNNNEETNGEEAAAASNSNELSELINTQDENNNNNNSVLAFIRTFVLSFFTSIIPDTPAL